MIKGIISFIIVVALCLGVWWWYRWYKDSVSYVSNQTGTIVIVVRESIASVSDDLAKAGLIKSKLAFKIYFRLNGNNDLVAGNYSFPSGSTIKDIADRLGRGEADPEAPGASN